MVTSPEGGPSIAPDEMPVRALGIIPARGGSKGVPRKNVLEVAGKPLIQWTIESAKCSKLLSEFVVSTEDPEIEAISLALGAQVLKRPAVLATDHADTLPVLQHVLEHYDCDVVVLLQPTSPVRRPNLIDDCIEEFVSGGFDSLATGFICNYKEYGTNEARRQDIEGFFYDDGNVYVMRADLLRAGDRYGEKVGKKLISRWENVEIDDEYDLFVVEQILKSGKHLI